VIKVAFWYDRPQEYTGGLNYMRNLLYALSVLEDRQIQPFIFFGKKVDEEVVKPFEALATVVRTSLLDRKSLAWYLHQILFRIFGSLLLVDLTIRGRGISIVSHADRVYGMRRKFKNISWIPDFQYLHLPELFPLDPVKESERMLAIARQSDALVLSSHAALADFQTIAGERCNTRIAVLQFVSQPGGAVTQGTARMTRAAVEQKYGFEGRYFFLPNQFWEHKNHIVAFEAVRLLKARGIEVLLLCTGNLRDYRVKHLAYIEGLKHYIDEHHLGSNIRILGMIEYADVLFLMRHSVAAINPSKFEGWSSTVEEARSIGKRVLLSDIPVHREQNPPDAQYFDPSDSEALANCLAWHWANSCDAISSQAEAHAARDLQERTLAYGKGYAQLVLDVAAQPSRVRLDPEYGQTQLP
jgi:glycosyltransferase involved in cell wall biosynthesis